MKQRDRISTFLILSAAVYLGFYIFGLVMGVYSPGEVPYFTIPALVMAAVLIAVIYRGRRAASVPADDPLIHTAHNLRETRGF
jgi:hypothetical protein